MEIGTKLKSKHDGMIGTIRKTNDIFSVCDLDKKDYYTDRVYGFTVTSFILSHENAIKL